MLLAEWPCGTGDWQCFLCGRLGLSGNPWFNSQEKAALVARLLAAKEQSGKTFDEPLGDGMPLLRVWEVPGVRRSGKTLKTHVHDEYWIDGLCSRLDEYERMRFLIRMFIEHGMEIVYYVWMHLLYQPGWWKVACQFLFMFSLPFILQLSFQYSVGASQTLKG